MENNLREKFIRNLSSSSNSSIKDFTDDVIVTNNDKILPGLGVMFEILWRNSSPNEKEKIVSVIKSSLS